MHFTQGKCLLQRTCEGDIWCPINGNDNERHSQFIGAGKAYPTQTTFVDLLLRLHVGAALIAADILPAILGVNLKGSVFERVLATQNGDNSLAC